MGNSLWGRREQVEKLGELIDAGKSASEAARLLGHRYTRNAVLGKAFRMGWNFGTARTEAQRDRVNHIYRPPRGRTVDYGAPRIRVSAAFDPDVYAEIVERATKEGSSVPSVIRDLVEWGLEA